MKHENTLQIKSSKLLHQTFRIRKTSQIAQLSDSGIGNLVSLIPFGCENVQGRPESFRRSSKACENDPT